MLLERFALLSFRLVKWTHKYSTPGRENSSIVWACIRQARMADSQCSYLIRVHFNHLDWSLIVTDVLQLLHIFPAVPMVIPAELLKLLVDWVDSKKWSWGLIGGVQNVRFYAYPLTFGTFYAAADMHHFLGEDLPEDLQRISCATVHSPNSSEQ